MNQNLECYLRCYINYHQDDWIRLLPSAEFAYNQSMNASTGKIPFEEVLRFTPEFRKQVARETQVRKGENPAARELAERLDEGVQQGKDFWEKTQESTTRFYNKKHKDMMFKLSDEVLLSSRHIRILRPSRKLADKFLGPFQIIACVGKNAYTLDLPLKYGRIHPTFPVAFLEPYRRRNGVKPPEPIDIEGEEEWVVDKILDEREARGRSTFLVRWEGFSADHDTWEPEENLVNAQGKIQDYRERRT